MCKPSSPSSKAALLLELAASDDLPAFKAALDVDGVSIADSAPWYGVAAAPNAAGARRMAVEDRTPAMIAALYGSASVLAYVLAVAPDEARRRSSTDGSTPLHCVAAGGAASAPEVARLLVAVAPEAVDDLDGAGCRPADVIARNFLKPSLKALRVLLKANPSSPTVVSWDSSPAKEEEFKSGEKREFPQDSTLPDIKNGIFSTDEFRMYTFKVRPCSRAYSHDWTECPFVHPGENARRRDPRKYAYSCVPCPEFKKSSTCRNGDACDYAHGVFESWLHPAQYRTRLCKDEFGCNRRVCFFAHKPEELREVNPSTVSAMPGMMISSPKASSLSSPNFSALDRAASLMLMHHQQPESPRSPSAGSATAWVNQNTPPLLQLPASRLKASLSARDLGFDLELLGLENYQHKLIDEMSASPRMNGIRGNLSTASRPSEYNNLLGPVDPLMLTQLQELSMKQHSGPQFQSPTGIHMHQSHLLAGYGNRVPSSPPVSASLAPSFGADPLFAKAPMNSRASAFANRSQSFNDRVSLACRQSTLFAVTTRDAAPSVLADWGSPGKLDWGVQGEELSKLKKSVSFNYSNGQAVKGAASDSVPTGFADDNLPWVQSLVTEGPTTNLRENSF